MNNPQRTISTILLIVAAWEVGLGTKLPKIWKLAFSASAKATTTATTTTTSTNTPNVTPNNHPVPTSNL